MPTITAPVELCGGRQLSAATQVHAACEGTSVKPIGYTRSYLACTIGHLVPI
jgi:hypothetical protein